MVLAILFGPPLAILAVMIYIRNGRLQFTVVGGNKELMSKEKGKGLSSVCVVNGST